MCALPAARPLLPSRCLRHGLCFRLPRPFVSTIADSCLPHPPACSPPCRHAAAPLNAFSQARPRFALDVPSILCAQVPMEHTFYERRALAMAALASSSSTPSMRYVAPPPPKAPFRSITLALDTTIALGKKAKRLQRSLSGACAVAAAIAAAIAATIAAAIAS